MAGYSVFKYPLYRFKFQYAAKNKKYMSILLCKRQDK